MTTQLQPSDVGPWVAGTLLNGGRTRPVVAVTTHPGYGRTLISAEELAQALGDAAEVVCLETGDATWELSGALPPRLDVYGGAARIWWPGLTRDSDPYDHRLYFIHSEREGSRVTQAIVRAILGERDGPVGAATAQDRAKATPSLTSRTDPQATSGPATGPQPPAPQATPLLATVVRAEGTEVELEADGRRGRLHYADVPVWALARCLDQGAELPVRPDPRQVGGTWRFSTQGMLPEPWDLVAGEVTPDRIVTGRVCEVRDRLVLVEVLPRVRGIVYIDDVDWSYVQPGKLQEFATVGQVLPVKVLEVDPGRKRIHLSIKEALPNLAPRPGDLPSLVPGGRPFTWPEGSAAGGSSGDEEPDPRDERIAGLEEELEAVRDDRAALLKRRQDLDKQVRSLRDRLEAIEKERAPERDPLSSDRAFLLAVRLAYAREFDEGPRHRYPLQRMRVGPAFLDSLRALDGIELDKVLEVAAQVAAGLAHEIEGREVHRLREGAGGSNSLVRDRDGAIAWRCALQVKSPSARRLHWWAIPGGREGAGQTIEFANVGLHDDFGIG